jgi:hypothetical protein
MFSANAKMALLLTLSFILMGCDVGKPKVLGKSKLDFETEDSATPESFKFNFAFRDATAAAPLDKIIYLQGASNTKTGIISTCNSAGTNCVCEFYNASDVKLEESDFSEITFDTTGNYVRCEYDGILANLSKVVIRNQNNTVRSAVYNVDTTLTAQKLVGDDLDANRIRTVYRYDCEYNFLQKAGTTSTFFDCSSSGSLCWDNGGQAGDFCILQSKFPFHLFSDNYSTNLNTKVADKLYGVGAEDRICGAQIKQFDCAGASGTPVPQFAIFAEQTGIFDTAIQLSAGPDISLSTYGFAAKTSTFNGSVVCPPGMVRQVFYGTTTDTSDLGNDSNYPNAFALREMSSPTVTPEVVQVNKLRGKLNGSTLEGDCNGTACAPPRDPDGQVTTFTYSSAGQTEFCVIPTTLLP